ncbi:MAG: trypsin-like peptidase domain-containing protein [Myxococcaceae bacterium]|nr:trypsin-like peptidase domain-containing protein [Myxococcaceae bacterium]
MSHSHQEANAPLNAKLLPSLLLCVLLLSGCHACSSNTDPPASASQVLPVSESTPDAGPLPESADTPPPPRPREPDGIDFDDEDHPEDAAPWMKEAGPFPGGMYLAAGKPDFANQYPSTVMVSRLGPLKAAQCSGVLLTPSLVLTAANCVCRPRKVPSAEDRNSILFDTSACVETAYITTTDYGEVINEYIAATNMYSIPGMVRPHPDFKLVLDEDRNVAFNHADLAVILLRHPVKSRFPPASLSSLDIRAQETLIMAGYGYGQEFGQIAGLRFVRRNKVLGEAAPSDDGRFLYEQQGAFMYRGFKGGPCFRQEGSHYKLAGIASIGTDKELSLTSVSFYRDWLDSELRHASKHAPKPKKQP